MGFSFTAVITIVKMFSASLNYSQYAARTKNQSLILLSLFLSFDIFFLISGVIRLTLVSPFSTLISSSPVGDEDYIRNIEQAIIPAIIAFFTTSLICNSLAIFGVCSGKRVLILPWLILFFGVKIVLMIAFVNDLLLQPLNMGQFFLVLLLLFISAWRHMQVQYLLLGLASQPQVSDSGETGIASTRENNKAQHDDLPPKYEDVAETPPKYDEATMKTSTT